jgi:hypothetical protein
MPRYKELSRPEVKRRLLDLIKTHELRLSLLRDLLRDGTVSIARRVRVREYDVDGYTVTSHWRTILPRRAPATKKGRRA